MAVALAVLHAWQALAIQVENHVIRRVRFQFALLLEVCCPWLHDASPQTAVWVTITTGRPERSQQQPVTGQNTVRMGAQPTSKEAPGAHLILLRQHHEVS